MNSLVWDKVCRPAGSGSRHRRASPGLPLIPIFVMADKSIHFPDDAFKIIKEETTGYINIKLMKSRGFWEAGKIAALAEATGVGPQVGRMIVEIDLALAAVYLACGLSNVRFRDLDIGSPLRESWTSGVDRYFKDGYMILESIPKLRVIKLNERISGISIKIYN